jgi:hypothetical protein
MSLHFSLVAYLIIDLAQFYLPIIVLLWVIHDLFGKWLIIILYLFTLLKNDGLGCLLFLQWGSGGYKSTGVLLSILGLVL